MTFVHRSVLLLLLGDADPPTLLETSRSVCSCSRIVTRWKQVGKNMGNILANSQCKHNITFLRLLSDAEPGIVSNSLVTKVCISIGMLEVCA